MTTNPIPPEKCPRCESTIEVGSKFCGQCGTRTGQLQITDMQTRSLPSLNSDLTQMGTFKPDASRPTFPHTQLAELYRPIQPHTTSRPQVLRIILVALTIVVLLAGSLLFFTRHQDNGLGTVTRTYSGNGYSYTIGIVEGKDPYPFVDKESKVAASEAALLTRIAEQNQIAEKSASGNYVTVIVATTLSSSTPTDSLQSAEVGIEELRGVSTAQEKNNESSPLKLKVLIANVGDKDASSEFGKTIAENGVKYAASDEGRADHLLGFSGAPFSVTVEAMLGTLQAAHMSLISSNATSSALDTEPFFRRIPSTNGQQAPLIVAYMARFAPRKVLITADVNDTYSRNFAKVLKDAMTGAPWQVDEHDYTSKNVPDSDNLSLPTLANFIDQSGASIVFYAGFPNELSKLFLYQQANSLNFPMFMGGGGLFELGGYNATVKKVRYASVTFPAAENIVPSETEYTNRYAQTYDPENLHPHTYGWSLPTTNAVNADDAVTAYMTVAGKLDRNFSFDDVSNRLSTLSFNGITGPINYTPGSANPLQHTLYMVCILGTHEDWDLAYTFTNGQVQPHVNPRHPC